MSLVRIVPLYYYFTVYSAMDTYSVLCSDSTPSRTVLLSLAGRNHPRLRLATLSLTHPAARLVVAAICTAAITAGPPPAQAAQKGGGGA